MITPLFLGICVVITLMFSNLVESENLLNFPFHEYTAAR